jgi:hypothetical protein
MAEENTHIWEDKVEIVLQVIGRACHALHVGQHAQNIVVDGPATATYRPQMQH